VPSSHSWTLSSRVSSLPPQTNKVDLYSNTTVRTLTANNIHQKVVRNLNITHLNINRWPLGPIKSFTGRLRSKEIQVRTENKNNWEWYLLLYKRVAPKRH